MEGGREGSVLEDQMKRLDETLDQNAEKVAEQEVSYEASIIFFTNG